MLAGKSDPVKAHLCIEQCAVIAAMLPLEQLWFTGKGSRDSLKGLLRGILPIRLSRGRVAMGRIIDNLVAYAAIHLQRLGIAVYEAVFLHQEDRVLGRIEWLL